MYCWLQLEFPWMSYGKHGVPTIFCTSGADNPEIRAMENSRVSGCVNIRTRWVRS